MIQKEIWKDIVGYEGLYQISNYGRVKSLGNDKTRKERILKPIKSQKGYLRIIFCKKGKTKQFYIHCLVAENFIPNPLNLPQVNHKDENKENNCVYNLEWCDAKYNNNYGTRIEKTCKKVYQYSKRGIFIKEWDSTIDIERELEYNQGNISKCCNGKYKSAYGYIWSYEKREP